MRKIVCKLFVLGIFIFICASCGNKYKADRMVTVACAGEYEAVVCEEQAAAEYEDEAEVAEVNLKDEKSVMKFTSPIVSETAKDTIISKSTNESALLKKKIIKDGDINIQTQNIDAAKKRIDNLVKSLNAYYEQEHFNTCVNRISYALTIRVPADNFDKMVSFVEQGKDVIEDKHIRVRDVTEEYADITARLASKKDYLKQYAALLARANSIKDILEIKENIRKLQEEIESAEGRIRYLNDQITFSTLEVYLEQKIDYVYKPTPKDSFIERVKSSLSTGWTVIVETFYFLLSIWWFFIILIAAFFFVRRKIKKRKAKKNKKE